MIDKKIVKAIIPAAGFSERMKLRTPKQLAKILSRPLIYYTLDVFERCNAVDGIILAANKRYLRQCRDLVKRYACRKIEQVCIGGRTRQESVFNALEKVKDCDYLIVHDGVRPFISKEVILDLLKAVRRFDAVTCALKAVDTIVEAEKGCLSRVLCRDLLWQIQTPQAFKFDLLKKAHRLARAKRIFNATDDAQMVLRLKQKVRLIPGSFENFKITTVSDFALAKRLLEKRCRN